MKMAGAPSSRDTSFHMSTSHSSHSNVTSGISGLNIGLFSNIGGYIGLGSLGSGSSSISGSEKHAPRTASVGASDWNPAYLTVQGRRLAWYVRCLRDITSPIKFLVS